MSSEKQQEPETLAELLTLRDKTLKAMCKPNVDIERYSSLVEELTAINSRIKKSQNQ